mmetsp:Transcript_99832/g.122113  ORF Transcript_99832/g.122113 Transcript_99832/m.122113 type:complete len:124 (-) Transcript_99832:136-507(-)
MSKKGFKKTAKITCNIPNSNDMICKIIDACNHTNNINTKQRKLFFDEKIIINDNSMDNNNDLFSKIHDIIRQSTPEPIIPTNDDLNDDINNDINLMELNDDNYECTYIDYNSDINEILNDLHE